MLNPILQAFFQSAQQLNEKKEGSGSRSGPLTNGSGSWRTKNMRIRIHNTVLNRSTFICTFERKADFNASKSGRNAAYRFNSTAVRSARFRVLSMKVARVPGGSARPSCSRFKKYAAASSVSSPEVSWRSRMSRADRECGACLQE